MAGRRNRRAGASMGRAARAAADTVQSMTEAMVATGLRGMQMAASMAPAAAKGTVRAGRRVGGTTGNAAADTTETLPGIGSQAAETSADVMRRNARTVGASPMGSGRRRGSARPRSRRRRDQAG